MPLDHLPYSENYSDTISIKIKNLDKNIHPLNYSLEADLPSENLQFKYYDKEPLKPILNGLEEREIKIKQYRGSINSNGWAIIIGCFGTNGIFIV